MEGFLTTTVEALVERARKEKRVHPLFSASEKAEVSARISEAVHDSQEKVGAAHKTCSGFSDGEVSASY